MPSKYKKIDQLVQYILATAGQEDYMNRELGPIHLIKYIYIADLEYARQNGGVTYTGLPWRFHHFGPWCTEAFRRIEPSLQSVGAKKRIIEAHSTAFDGEFIRWIIVDDDLYEKLERELPLIITTTIQKYVHKFSAITEDLLHYVYNTWPMLKSKPGEMLDFSVPDYIQRQNESVPDIEKRTSDNLSARQKKKKKQSIEALKEEFKNRLEKKKKAKKHQFTPPPYDDIFFEGLKTLDSLAGDEIKPVEGIVQFSEDIWKSKSRFDPDVS